MLFSVAMPAHHEHPGTAAARRVAVELDHISTIKSLAALLEDPSVTRAARRLVAERLRANAYELYVSLEYPVTERAQ